MHNHHYEEEKPKLIRYNEKTIRIINNMRL